MSVQPTLHIRLLGQFSVDIGGKQIGADRWRQRKPAGIIKLLALQPNYQMHREQLMDALWPDLSSQAAANNLRRSLHHVRRALADTSGQKTLPFLRREGDLIQLGAPDQVWIDVTAFEQSSREAWRTQDIAAFQRAHDLYAGDLLPEDRYEDWVEEPRIALQTTYQSLVEHLARLHEERGEPNMAIAVLEHLLKVQPSRESAHATLMRILAETGQRGRAIDQYENLVRTLDQELGSHPEPITEELYEAIVAGRFPRQIQPLESANPASASETRMHRSSVPTPLASLVGRQRELAELSDMLQSSRLVTLTGAGGSGKTRLALALVPLVRDRFPDGVVFVSLAPLRDPASVVSTIAQALGIRELGQRTIDKEIEAFLQRKRLLLVLDNVEHVAAAGTYIAALLAQCADLQVLATSRAPLHLSGEQEFAVLPLPVPETTTAHDIDQVRRSDAVELFLQRAQAVRQDFMLTTSNAATIVSICQRLGGLPLAIELAAARCKILSPTAIDQYLEQPFAFLTSGPRDLPERQRTLGNTIQWSHDLLEPDVQQLYRRLSAFLGGWTLAAAKAVAHPEGLSDSSLLDGLTSLVDNNLIIQEETPIDETRFSMLEPIREFASDLLVKSGEAEAVSHRHAAYFVEFLEHPIRRWFANEMDTGEQLRWLDRFDLEQGNFDTALAWAAEHDTTLGLRFVAVLWPVWFVQARFSDGYRWASLLTAQPTVEQTPTYATAQFAAGLFLERMGQDREATSMLEAAAAVSRDLGAVIPLALSLNFLGNLARSYDRDAERAKALYTEACELFRSVDFTTGVALATANLGLIARLEGDYHLSRHFSQEALQLSKPGVPWVVSLALSNLADLALRAANVSEARALCAQSLRLSLQLEQRLTVRDKVARQLDENDPDPKLRLEIGNHLGVAGDLFLLARIEASDGGQRHAAQLVGVVKQMLASVGLDVRALHWRATEWEVWVAALRTHLGEQRFAAAIASGRSMPVEQVVARALNRSERANPRSS